MKLPLLLLGLLLLVMLWPPNGHGRHHRHAVAGRRVAPVRVMRSAGAAHRVKVVRAVR